MTDTEPVKGKLAIGPAGWSYKDWVGPVYPAGKRIDQLLTIARYFNCIELNSSFYRVPGRRLVESWARRLSTKPDFNLTVKVWRQITHERKCDSGTVKYFVHAFDDLLVAGQIGAFLLQFPWSFRNRPESRKYLERLGNWFGEHPTAVELRHGSWNSPDTIELLSQSGLAFCNIDQPVIGDSLPPTDFVADNRIGYIRLHGRNRKNWFNEKVGRDERYDYLYDDRELDGWKDRAKKILGRVSKLFIITNNHFRGQALVNAFQLKSILEKRNPDIPSELMAAYPALRSIAANESPQGDLLGGL